MAGDDLIKTGYDPDKRAAQFLLRETQSIKQRPVWRSVDALGPFSLRIVLPPFWFFEQTCPSYGLPKGRSNDLSVGSLSGSISPSTASFPQLFADELHLMGVVDAARGVEERTAGLVFRNPPARELAVLDFCQNILHLFFLVYPL
jgi:hypothetical protein